MAGRIIIDTERCKGCGLCIIVCPNKSIIISKQSNKKGYFPAQPASSNVEGTSNNNCTGCAMCAIICPDAVIEVYRDSDSEVKVVKSGKKKHSHEILQAETSKNKSDSTKKKDF